MLLNRASWIALNRIQKFVYYIWKFSTWEIEFQVKWNALKYRSYKSEKKEIKTVFWCDISKASSNEHFGVSDTILFPLLQKCWDHLFQNHHLKEKKLYLWDFQTFDNLLYRFTNTSFCFYQCTWIILRSYLKGCFWSNTSYQKTRS